MSKPAKRPRPPAPKRSKIGALYDVAPMARVALVREGLPAETVGALAREMGVPREKLYATIGVARATMERKLSAGDRLSPAESEKVLGVGRLVAQVERMVQGADGAEDFDAARWLAGWLDSPLPALGNERPAALMDTEEGRAIVSTMLGRIETGTYS